MLGTELIQPIEQPIAIQPQGLQQLAAAGLLEEGLEEVLHIQLPMAPAAGLVLGAEQQVPGQVGEPFRFAGKADAAVKTEARIRRPHQIGFSAE